MLERSDADAGKWLPLAFCWTKYGTEAGEGADSILRRKDDEREKNGGLFLWGIGNAIGPSVRQLVDEVGSPQVVFTPMLSRATQKDVAPAGVARWHSGLGLDGKAFQIPTSAVVTSRLGNSRGWHYALVCRSLLPLAPLSARNIAPSSFASTEVQNLRSGAGVGPSQVTSVVRRVPGRVGADGRRYRVSFVADLVHPYLVRLTECSITTSNGSLPQ